MKKLDAFAAINTALFLALCVFRYYARFLEYRGAGHLHEFFIYAGAILVGIGVLWWRFRDRSFDTSLLMLLEFGILLHFSGALVRVDGGRLYDVQLAGIRYDKFVHGVNAFAGMALMRRIFRIERIDPTPVAGGLLLLAVMGLGAVVELVEYLVVLTVPDNGVGAYDNNMQDLIANLAGSIAYLAYRSVFARLDARPSALNAQSTPAASVAKPRNVMNPMTSVTVVSTIDDDAAGS